ncbi:MAG: gephyrin-like molybdotransferase Glp [Flavitalea sp.]
MITVTEAKRIIADNIFPLSKKKMALMDAVGSVLADDCIAKCDVPAFNQSGMDGYAIIFNDRHNSLKIMGEIAAGQAGNQTLQPGETIRIFTGAPIPNGADTIVIQEKVAIENKHILFKGEEVQQGAYVRLQGSDINSGDTALTTGSFLSPGAIGFLASVGMHEVSVIPSPKIHLIITGSELTKPGKALIKGQVYESNSFALCGALSRAGITEIEVSYTDDDPQHLIAALSNAMNNSDMILLTGGISVGDYDFVLPAVTKCGVKTMFHKVKQRPGKPLFFGMKDKKPVFGLPGNPSSVLTCFYEYVLPAIGLLTGKKDLLKTESSILEMSWQKSTGLTHFLKGVRHNSTVTISGAQESFKMSSFALANCLIVLPENESVFNKGDAIEIHLIP